MIRELTASDKINYEKIVSHPLQSWAWGEFRKASGVKVVRLGVFSKNKLVSGYQITFHPLPHTPWTIGYLPKSDLPTHEVLEKLKEVGEKYNCIFIQLEPNVTQMTNDQRPTTNDLCPSVHPLFTKYTFHIDLTRPEEELLKKMSSKTRYNIKVAQKHGVTIQEENTQEAFNQYLQLTQETTQRQGFFAHDKKYHQMMWKYLNLQPTTCNSQPIAHLFTARFQGEILVTWILFLHNHVLYYPYGASSSRHRNVMAGALMMWEMMRWGKQQEARTFDLWGTPGPNPKSSDPYYGFHRFKLGFGPQLVEFIGSYDLIIQPFYYELFKLADKLRWLVLRLKTKL